jgi:phosphate-selective porin
MRFLQTRRLIAGGLLAAATTVSVSAPVQAQQSEVEQLRALIGELTSRLTKLEEAQSAAATAAKTAPKPLTSRGAPVTVSGLLQVHGLGFLGQDGPGTKQPDTFRLRRGEIRLTGQITPKLIGTIQLDPAKALNLNAAGNAINQSGTLLQEIALQYQLAKKGTNSHFVDIGQFKIPLGYEGDQVSSAALQTVERALMFTQRDPFGGGYGDVRDTGVRLRGNFGDVAYDLGAFNGFGDRQNALAQTDQKAIIGRLAYRPAKIQGLQLGISGGTGGPGGADRSLVNAFAAYKRDKWTFQTEFLDGKTQGPLGAPPVATLRDIRGYYGSVGYLFTPKLEGVLRYDYFDTDTNLANADGNDITLGANYYIKGNNAKIQVNLVRRDGNPAARTGNGLGDLRNDRYELRTNFQVGF